MWLMGLELAGQDPAFAFTRPTQRSVHEMDLKEIVCK